MNPRELELQLIKKKFISQKNQTEKLSYQLLICITSYLSLNEIVKMATVNSLWKLISDQHPIWKSTVEKKPFYLTVPATFFKPELHGCFKTFYKLSMLENQKNKLKGIEEHASLFHLSLYKLPNQLEQKIKKLKNLKEIPIEYFIARKKEYIEDLFSLILSYYEYQDPVNCIKKLFLKGDVVLELLHDRSIRGQVRWYLINNISSWPDFPIYQAPFHDISLGKSVFSRPHTAGLFSMLCQTLLKINKVRFFSTTTPYDNHYAFLNRLFNMILERADKNESIHFILEDSLKEIQSTSGLVM